MGLVQGLGESNRHGLIAAKRSVGIAQNYIAGRSLRMHFDSLGRLPSSVGTNTPSTRRGGRGGQEREGRNGSESC
eukprot:8288690-Pyramimonas_sp.AAC.1